MDKFFVVIHSNYAEGLDAYVFVDEQTAQKCVQEDVNTEMESLTEEGYCPVRLTHSPGHQLDSIEVYVPDTDIYYQWDIIPSNVTGLEKDDRTYIVVEWCPHCEHEIEMRWDTDKRGFKAFCPVCGERLMLCDECQHTEGSGECDYNGKTDSCYRNPKGDE